MKHRSLCESCITVVGLLQIYIILVLWELCVLVDFEWEGSVAYTRAMITNQDTTVSCFQTLDAHRWNRRYD